MMRQHTRAGARGAGREAAGRPAAGAAAAGRGAAAAARAAHGRTIQQGFWNNYLGMYNVNRGRGRRALHFLGWRRLLAR
jgi:hypothetical protein